jgi:hypothetical protein
MTATRTLKLMPHLWKQPTHIHLYHLWKLFYDYESLRSLHIAGGASLPFIFVERRLISKLS